MTNDVMVSKLAERLGSLKCDKEDDLHVWTTSFPQLLTLSRKENSLSIKAMIT